MPTQLSFDGWLRLKGHVPENLSDGLRGALRQAYQSSYTSAKRKRVRVSKPEQPPAETENE